MNAFDVIIIGFGKGGKTLEKEYRATTLIEMGGLLLQKMWFTVWPVIQKPLDAGFAAPIFRRNLHLMLFLSVSCSV